MAAAATGATGGGGAAGQAQQEQQQSSAGGGSSSISGSGGAPTAAAASSGGVAALAQRALGDVLVLDVAANAWRAPTVRAPDGGGPGPRAFHSAAPVGPGVAVFGGHTLTLEAGRKRRVFYNDAWLLLPHAAQVMTATTVWWCHIDDDACCVLGERNSLQAIAAIASCTHLIINAVCTLSLSPLFQNPQGNDGSSWEWSRITIAEGSPLPPKRDMASLVALDASRLLLFGGRSEQQRALNDCWLFDLNGKSWRQLVTSGAVPPARKMAALTLLPPTSAPATVALFGGERDNGLLDDLWIGRVTGDEAAAAMHWTPLRLKGAPPPRFGHALVAAPATELESAQQQQQQQQQQEQQPAQQQQHGAVPSAPLPALLYTFGGCIDHSTLPFLARSYAQTQELWAADLSQPVWVGPLTRFDAGGGGIGAPHGADWPSERMAHTLTPLADGRALLLGGRWREGICSDAWWLQLVSVVSGPPI